jgi:type I restriction enzyme S subunit
MATNQGFITFNSGRDLDSHFLLNWLVAQRPNLVAAAGGSTFKELSRGTAKLLPILLPPLDEQKRIAEVLRSVDEAIGANEAVAVQARRTYQAALTELVGKGLDHWETVCLGQIATFVNGRGFKPHEWGDKGFPIIRIQNLNGGTDFNYFSGDFNPKILVRPGDLLFAWSGSRGTSFGPHIWRGPEGVLNYHTWKVVPVAPEDRDYLYFALRHLTKKIEDEAHGASALVHMQKAYVVDYEIQLPPPDERIAIAATLIDLQEAANHADRVYREARAVKGDLMADLLSGHTRVPA